MDDQNGGKNAPSNTNASDVTNGSDGDQAVTQQPVSGQQAPQGAPKLKEPFDFAQGKQKEKGPIVDVKSVSSGEIDYAQADRVAKEEKDEYWENYAREIELEKEILEMGGVEKIESGEVAIPEQVAREMGVQPSVGAHTPMSSVTGFSISGASLSDDQLALGLAKPTSSGFRWLVEWFIYQLLKAHFHIKRIGGKVIRQGGA